MDASLSQPRSVPMRQLQQQQQDELVAAPAYIRQPSAANGTGTFPAAVEVPGADGKGTGTHVPVQQEQLSPSRKEAAAARHIKAHLSRPAVSRSLLHHLAKGFGVQLQGDVVTNEVSTAKYTVLTFVPVNLFEQFLRVANLYFLLMAILQLIPGLSPTSWFTTVAPLVFVLAVNAIKEGYDDVHRHRNDNQVNNRKVILLSQQGDVDQQQEVTWKDVVAGDLLKVRADEEVPADLLLLSSPDPDNLCYVETANLDGETNLKIKYCWSMFTAGREAQHFQDLAQDWTIGYEAPNEKLYVFDGYAESAKVGKQPLDINNLLLRGSVLRKTEWVIGVALNVGKDSKIVRNMTKAPRKVTQLERNMNVLVFVQFTALVVFCAVLAGLDQWWAARHSAPSWWYLQSQNVYPELPPGVAAFFISFLRFLILLSNMIPISLYVSLEVVKVFQCTLLLNSDRQMYHRDTDTPFVCRTTTLNEELGQVQYVLSDKTGTLTQNVMGFVWASVGGVLYGQHASEDKRLAGMPANTPHSIALDDGVQKALFFRQDKSDKNRQPQPALLDFLTNLAVCNTVVPSVNPDGSLLYQASSPDEEALVQGAAYLSHRLVSRTTEQVKVDIRGALHTYDILATLEFNSDRKRMSIIVRTPQDRLMLFCKGADSIILSRLAAGEPGVETVKQHLDEMAHAGYRTLLVAQRELSREEYEQWEADYSAAQVSMVDREGRMAAEQERIERGLHLAGATAVEDKLQDGVPECLQALAAAGVKVWVLTGDKVETAISIAYSCRLFTEDMGLVEFREAELAGAVGEDDQHPNVGVIQQVLAKKLAEVRQQNKLMQVVEGHTNCGIVIEGGALHYALHKACQDALMDLCKECRAVVCCRVTPKQKAEVTGMVKQKAQAITLGIGDGANDVGMIRSAHIGVGISGREGRAAVLASDFSFAQFRYLSRLLLLHGRWSFLRNREVVLYSFYKNWAYVMVYVYLQFVAGFSAVPIFTTLMISSFNMIFTACPIVAYAVLEQDMHVKTVLANPASYAVTRTATRGGFFWLFFLWIVAGTWHSLPVYFLPWYTLTTPDRNGLAQDLSGVGTAVFIALTFAVAFKLCLRTHSWNWITHLVYWLSLALLFPFVYVVSILWPSTSISGVADMAGTGAWLFTNPVFWLTTLVGAPAIALLPDIAVMLFRRYLRPDLVTLLQEAEVLEAVADLATHRRLTHGAGGFLNANNLEAMHQQRRGSDSANDDSPAAQLARSSRGAGRGAAAPAAAGVGSAGGAVPSLEMGALAMTADAQRHISKG
uniref:Phospholipid-transporting ATPase n=1 Tax=Tetradesmus obliquus TaxID=3088 RepID=A0A383WKY7_TETOB|eukprot:jgi/Sobl393_1/13295/SZX79213.1